MPWNGLADARALPLIIDSKQLGTDDLAATGSEERDRIRMLLTLHGAILFRDFPLRTPEQFRAAFASIVGTPSAYIERSSARQGVLEGVYTSTEYPADREILLHTEQSYNNQFPRYIAFFCQQPARVGGETPLADTRRVLAHIPEELRERLHRSGYRYVRNYGGRLRMTWQHAFGTEDADSLEAYCRESDVDVEWLGPRGGQSLRTTQTRRVIARHPISNELCWFNHLAFFHISSLDPDIRKLLMDVCGPDRLPHATLLGDGTPLSDECAAQLRSAYRHEQKIFGWQQGDLLLVDNMLVAHGRRPFAGDRAVLVAMGSHCHWSAVSVPPQA